MSSQIKQQLLAAVAVAAGLLFTAELLHADATQFGLLRHDMTSRPGYVGLAALGRFLAGARCLGRLERIDEVCPVVLQCAMPKGTTTDIKRIPWASEYEYTVEASVPCPVQIYAYNFSSEAVRGTVRLEGLPAGCKAEPTEWEVEIGPMGRVELSAHVTITKEMTAEVDDRWFTLGGDFGAVGRPVLVFRLVAVNIKGGRPL